jgi:hypothetical protein
MRPLGFERIARPIYGRRRFLAGDHAMARQPLAEKRATKLRKLKTLQTEIDGLNAKAAKRIGALAIRAGLADLNISDIELLREFRDIVSRRNKPPTA